MLTITKLKMWKDPGYTRGCLEIPPAGSRKLPAADYSSDTTLRPRKNSTLTALELPLSYTQVFEMSYLYIEASDGNGNLALFGWIESIEQTASAEAAILIRWSVDWWRSYSDSAVFKRARVTHCANSSFKRPYRNEPRKWKVSHSNPLIIGSREYPYCVVIAFNEVEHKSEDVSIGGVPAVAQWTVTNIRYAFWECNLMSGKDSKTIDNNSYDNPSLRDVFTGNIDEILGINPETITGIFILPYLAWSKFGSTIHGDPNITGSKFAYLRKTDSADSGGLSFDLDQEYVSDDYRRTIIMDPNGSIVGTLPWGYAADHIEAYADVGAVSASLRVAMRKTDGELNPPAFDAVASSAEGLSVDIPGLTCPVNSNGWSSYVYSGQRDYEIRTKEAQRSAKAFEGVMSGGLIGSIVGQGQQGENKFPTGAIVGGALGAGASYLLSGVTDDKLQELTDQLHSNQTSNLLMGGGGEGFAYAPAVKDWYIVQLVADDVSMDEYEDNIALNGYETDMTVPDVTSFITAGGAFSCSDLVITGDLPPQAKQEIKSKLESGVYITENNPSGVVP